MSITLISRVSTELKGSHTTWTRWRGVEETTVFEARQVDSVGDGYGCGGNHLVGSHRTSVTFE